MAKAPFAVVKEKFGSKDALVDKVAGLVEPLEGESRDDLKTRLKSASNKKLLKLLNVEEKSTEIFGGKEALVDAYVKTQRPGAKKADGDFRAKVAKKSKAELLMLQGAAQRKVVRAKAKAAR